MPLFGRKRWAPENDTVSGSRVDLSQYAAVWSEAVFAFSKVNDLLSEADISTFDEAARKRIFAANKFLETKLADIERIRPDTTTLDNVHIQSVALFQCAYTGCASIFVAITESNQGNHQSALQSLEGYNMFSKFAREAQEDLMKEMAKVAKKHPSLADNFRSHMDALLLRPRHRLRHPDIMVVCQVNH